MNVTLINVSDCEINYNWSLIYETWQGHLLSLWEFGVWLNGPSSQVCLLSKQHLVLLGALIACHASIYSLVLSCQSADRCRLHANTEKQYWHFSSSQMWSCRVNTLLQLNTIKWASFTPITSHIYSTNNQNTIPPPLSVAILWFKCYWTAFLFFFYRACASEMSFVSSANHRR